MPDRAPGRGRLRSRGALAALVALVPAIPIVAGLLINSSGVAARPVNGPGFAPVGQQAPATSNSDHLPGGSGFLVAVVRHRTTMRSSPGGRALARVPLHTEFGSPEAVWVVQHQPKWLGVVSSLAGNGHVGWIPRSATTLGRVPWELKVSLKARRLIVINAGRVVQRYTVAVGRASAPTPTGRFAVTDRLNTHDPSGPYGCCILALSAHSPHAIQGWSGGNRIAIHSTPETSSIGQPVSHGCVRLTLADGRWLMAHVPIATPTIISS